jgi:hypothetical protein
MQKEVLFRARQNVTFGDLNNTQNYAKKTFDDLVFDMLVSGRGYAGFQTTKATSTNLSVEPGRLYDTGKVFSSDSVVTVSLTPYLPSVAKKIVTLVVYGQSVDTDVEPRDFLINVTTRATEPQSVAMTRHRHAVISPVAGLEAADPLPPAVQTGYIAIATVVLNSSGIETVYMRSDTKVPELDEQATALSLIYNWQNTTGKIIDGLRTDITNLARRLDDGATGDTLRALAADVSTLKERVSVDRTYLSLLGIDIANIKTEVNAINDARPDLLDISSLYGADDFLDASESDVDHPNYLAKVQEGIRFSPAGQSISLFEVDNPYNGLVTVSANGLMTPKYTTVDGLVVGSQNANAIASEIPLADYQFTTWQFVEKKMSRQRLRYGDYFTVCTNSQFWQSGRYDPITGIFSKGGESWEVDPASYHNALVNHRWVRLRQVWTDQYEDAYWIWEPVNHAIQGSQLAQTFLNPQPRYCTGISLALTKVGPSGNVHVALCEVRSDGTPDLSAMISQATIDRANLKTFPADWTFVPLAPTFLKQGGRYAVVITTGGAHYVATVSGQNFTSGTLFFGTDGAYMLGDLTKDLMFKIHHAKFDRSSVTIDMKGLQLSGGINHVDMLAPMIVPASTNLNIQVRVDGVWKSLAYDPAQDGGLSILRGLPPLLPLRFVMTGTTDLLPIIDLAGSQVLLERPRTDFKHISTARTLPSGLTTKQVIVDVHVGNFDTVNHTLVAKLLYGSSYESTKTADAATLTVAADRPTEDKAFIKRFIFTFSTGIGAYKIQLEGTVTSPTNTYHVEKRVDNTIY